MPVYDYKCVKCGHRFDLLRAMSSRDAVTCPRCGGEVVRVYEGKWCGGAKSASGGCACGGNCAGCAGCGK